MQTDRKFNIRVYGLLIANNRVLVSDEFLWGKAITKFPGGGLEWGEGIAACLKREFLEELNCEINNEKLFYLNDFFQESLIDKNQQIISVYYTVSSDATTTIPVQLLPHEHPKHEHGSQVFRWIELSALNPADFHFPIDKIVAEQLNKLH